MPSREQLRELVQRALAEDVGAGDVTTEATVPASARARALITQKAPGVIFGLEPAELAFRALDPDARLAAARRGGRLARAGRPGARRSRVARRALLTAERTALNFLAHLSGVATMAARAVAASRGTGAQVLDTRKTTPGLRALEKAAVAAGGARNHRFGPLRRDPDQGEPHRGGRRDRARRSSARARPRPSWPRRSRSRSATRPRSTRRSPPGAPRLLLDNMDDDQLRAAVAQVAGRAELEASGGVTLDDAPGARGDRGRLDLDGCAHAFGARAGSLADPGDAAVNPLPMAPHKPAIPTAAPSRSALRRGDRGAAGRGPRAGRASGER